MILAFTQKINSKPTYFVEKIQTALRLPYFKDSVGFSSEHVPTNMNFYVKQICKPKLHTIREDAKDRWKAGTKIDFFINCRQPNMFRFAPRVPVVSVQKIEIEKLCDSGVWYQDFIVLVDDVYQDKKEIKAIAENDGFDSVEEFFLYFNTDFKGKLIHWTDLKY